MPCAFCPRIRRGIDGSCPAETLKHTAFCEFARQDAEGTIDPYHRGHIEYLCGEVVTPSPALPWKLQTPAEQERVRQIQNCPHKDGEGCGCRGSWCELGRKRVTTADCVTCIDSRP